MNPATTLTLHFAFWDALLDKIPSLSGARQTLMAETLGIITQKTALGLANNPNLNALTDKAHRLEEQLLAVLPAVIEKQPLEASKRAELEAALAEFPEFQEEFHAAALSVYASLLGSVSGMLKQEDLQEIQQVLDQQGSSN